MLRDTGLQVTDVRDMRAVAANDEDLLRRVQVLSKEDLDACRQWVREHPDGMNWGDGLEADPELKKSRAAVQKIAFYLALFAAIAFGLSLAL